MTRQASTTSAREVHVVSPRSQPRTDAATRPMAASALSFEACRSNAARVRP